MNAYAYPLEVEKEDDGSYSAQFIGLPGVTVADTIEELMVEARDCLEVSLASYMHDKMDIPPPVKAPGKRLIRPGVRMTAKITLYEAMRRKKIRNVALAKKLGCHESEVRRMIDPRYATKTETLEKALHAVGVDPFAPARATGKKDPMGNVLEEMAALRVGLERVEKQIRALKRAVKAA